MEEKCLICGKVHYNGKYFCKSCLKEVLLEAEKTGYAPDYLLQYSLGLTEKDDK